jgi:hypothetical protein
MQHGDKTDLCAEAFGIEGDFLQGFGNSLKKQIVGDLSVGQKQRMQGLGHGEDHVEVFHW